MRASEGSRIFDFGFRRSRLRVRAGGAWIALLLLPLVAFAGEAGTKPGEEKKSGDDRAVAEEKGEKEGEEGPDAATRKILDRVDATHKKIVSLRAPYGQVRKVKISRRLRKGKGELYLRKGAGGKGMEVLFVETEPFRSRVLFTDREVVFQDGETGEIKRRDPKQGGVKPSEIWVLGRPVSEIEKHYAVRRVDFDPAEKDAGERYLAKLEFVPKSVKIRKWVRRILIWLRKKDAFGVKVRIVDRTGDYQEFTFDEAKIEINPELEEDLFKIEK